MIIFKTSGNTQRKSKTTEICYRGNDKQYQDKSVNCYESLIYKKCLRRR